jgi:hypothetical protein
MLQTSIMRKKVEGARTEAVRDIKLIVGESKFNELLEHQGKYYEEYFKFDQKTEATEEVKEEQSETVEEKSK